MQIFLLNLNPRKAAQALCDKHCVKMPTETAQILSTVWKLSNPILYQQFYMNGMLYRPVRNYKHPVISWVMQSRQNYWYCVWLLAELCQEYTFRYKKVHSCSRFIDIYADKMPDPSLPDVGFVPMTKKFQAIPEDLKREDAVEAYRAYYLQDKKRFAVWNKGRNPPKWWKVVKS